MPVLLVEEKHNGMCSTSVTDFTTSNCRAHKIERWNIIKNNIFRNNFTAECSSLLKLSEPVYSFIPLKFSLYYSSILFLSRVVSLRRRMVYKLLVWLRNCTKIRKKKTLWVSMLSLSVHLWPTNQRRRIILPQLLDKDSYGLARNILLFLILVFQSWETQALRSL